MNYEKTTIVLTGATGGIGRELAFLLADRGARLLLVGRNEDVLADICTCTGHQNHYICADITTTDGREKVITWARQFDANILINNAGISQFEALNNISEQEFRAAMEVNVMAPVCLTRSFLQQVSADKHRTVVNVGSALGSIGFPFYTSYCASKFALRGFTEALGRELAGTKDKVLYFAPRATDTRMNTAQVNAMNKQMGNNVDSPRAVAQALIYQLEKGNRRYGVGLQESFFAKVNSVLPSLVDKVMSKKVKNIRQFVETTR